MAIQFPENTHEILELEVCDMSTSEVQTARSLLLNRADVKQETVRTLFTEERVKRTRRGEGWKRLGTVVAQSDGITGASRDRVRLWLRRCTTTHPSECQFTPSVQGSGPGTTPSYNFSEETLPTRSG